VSFASRAFDMPDIGFIRAEIDRMRLQIRRQRNEIQQLKDAGIHTTSADALWSRMEDEAKRLCTERGRLKAV
jgi:putative N-acetylmannosamine-6-phosphate epimerase